MPAKSTVAALAANAAMHRSAADLKRERIAAAIRANPDMTPTELGARFGVPANTVKRLAKELGLPLANGITRGAL